MHFMSGTLCVETAVAEAIFLKCTDFCTDFVVKCLPESLQAHCEVSLCCEYVLLTSARPVLEQILKDKQTMALSESRQTFCEF